MSARFDSFGGNDCDATIGGCAGVCAKRFASVEKLCFFLGGYFVWGAVELHFAEINIAILPFKHKVDLRTPF